MRSQRATPPNHAMQATACAIGKQVKGHGGLAPAAPDAQR